MPLIPAMLSKALGIVSGHQYDSYKNDAGRDENFSDRSAGRRKNYTGRVVIAE
jgi:hypothetical protein